METNDFTLSLKVKATASAVFQAVTNVRGWWSEEIEGNTAEKGDSFTYNYNDIHYCQVDLIEVIPDKKVVWFIKYNYFKFTKDRSEWTGTKIIFDITANDNETKLTFTHAGLNSAFECYNVCSNAWTDYLENSLRLLITTGKGKPNKAEGLQLEDHSPAS